MYKISSEFIASTATIGAFILPKAVDANCPHCNRKVTLTCAWKQERKLLPELMHASSTCPACHEMVTFILVNMNLNDVYYEGGELFIYPASHRREPLDEIAGALTERLERAYTAAINIYNLGEWNGAVVACRRALEGITKDLLPHDKRDKNLFKQIEELSNHRDFAKPIQELAHSLRSGGNLGAHFDLEKEANKEIATLMFDLLDSMIEYIYVLPEKIKSLESKIQSLNTDNG
ncbi:DUF4145 domain-containing protein [Hymenobacter psychrotolerans]|uniref:DUF4145 domain-containing protein n=1 Tax=Hymenobacter psychrotolerans DSM 18569 TaxID=1121959 RepID=A0A1M6PQS7_9BACT|nr:DUF4145 domain-containing protein [Hymenobacter psychrotolerans]SHK10208.1 protein of unknown function [Hymenobacter psychrotolerans DSM 18569]